MQSLIKAVSYASHLKRYYAAIIIASLLVALTGLAVPFVIKEAIDLMVEAIKSNTPDIRGVILLAIVLLGFDVLNTIIRNLGGYAGDMLAAKLKKQLSIRYFEHLLRLNQNYFDEELTGTIINRLNRAITEITNFLNIFANNFFQLIITSIITIGVVAFYSWPLAILVFSLYPIFLYLTSLTSKKWQRLQDQKNTVTDHASGRFAEVIAQIRIVKSYIQEKREFMLFSRQYQKTVTITADQSWYWHKMDIIRGLILSIIFFGIYVFIFIETVQQRYSIGDLVLLITLINGLRQPIFNLSFIIDMFQRAITGSKDYVKAMEVEANVNDQPNATNLSVKNGKITFQDVKFRYQSDQPVIKGLTFTIDPNTKLALVGESGQGKTTLTNLLMRMYNTDAGTISIDDQDIASVTQQSLRQSIATVFQEPALFSGTIRKNIAYARPSADQAAIESAARKANAHDFIMKLEKGYDSEIGERGIKLSGGQKQRIAIARAILKDAPILILDEATSSLDTRSEREVQKALDRLMKGKTTLIIAHRLSTIATVDTIVTLTDGTVNEVGSPAQLATSGGLYSQLLALQNETSDANTNKLKSYDIDG